MPVPEKARETVPFVTTCAADESTTPAWTSTAAYFPNSSSMSEISENVPLPFTILDLPAVSPPPFARRETRADLPLSHVAVPVPVAVE